MKPAGLVLAAGASSRPGFPKALARLGRRTLLRTAVETLKAAGCQRVVVVAGGVHAPKVAAVARRAGAQVARNPEPSRGMFSSLQLGLDAIGDHWCVVVSLVDHPHVQPATVDALVDVVAAGAGAAVPVYRGRTGHPLVVGRVLRGLLVSAEPTETADRVLSRFRRVKRVRVADPGVLEDLDTAGRLAGAGVRRP